MQDVTYHQVGGFGGGQQDSNDNLAARVMQAGNSDGIDMVLGIKPNGASYLLLPARVARRAGLRLSRPRRADEYESLSPIHLSKGELVVKLAMMKSKPSKKGMVARDRSKANTEYTAGGEGPSEAGMVRSSFEHQRVFYALCQNAIGDDRLPLTDFALNLAPDFFNIRIVSFSCDLWDADTRSLNEREGNPIVLDLGWTSFNSPTDERDVEILSTTHISVEENRLMGNPGRTRMTLPDITQVMNRDSVRSVLQGLFATHLNGELMPPKLLLVYDEKKAKSVLRSYGVDTSEWQVGIKSFLYRSHRSVDPARRRDGHWPYQEMQRDARGYLSRYKGERSLSPPRCRLPVREEHFVPSRARSPPPPRSTPPVCVVDIRQLYKHLMRDRSQDDTILSSADALHIRDTAPDRDENGDTVYVDVDPKKWCAGRDSRLLGYIWETMANDRLSIDEQRSRRLDEKPLPDEPYLKAPGQDYEDMDPNDIVRPRAQAAAPPKPSNPAGMYDSEDEDDDW